MDRWIDFGEWNKRRKKGLKNPTILWIASLSLTFALTILPSVLVSSLDAEDPSILFNKESWIKAIVDNLYPMTITQSVVTMLQNFSIVIPAKEQQKTRRFMLNFSWTVGLMICLIIYIIVYLAVVYAGSQWRNLALYIMSGFLAAVGLASVLQLDHEQEQVQRAIKAESQVQRAWRLENAGRDLVGTITPIVPPDTPPFSAEVGEESCTKDDMTVLK